MKIITSLVSITLLILIQSVSAQTPKQILPVDPLVKIGTLPNGLKYYIRQNKKPEQKVELRLVVNAGSILEDDDQQGLAHLSEHMAFNGTTHFKKNDIVSFLQTIGVSFGNDLNAYTSFDETVYILPIPTDKPANIEKGFQVIEDWAHNVTDKAEDIDAERPVVLEESRLGKGADERISRKLYPKIYEGSLYAKRLPIGLDSIVLHSSYASLRRFYRDWYRPNLMAVIVVGDIDPALAEAMIKKHFAGLVNPAKERKRQVFNVPPYSKSEALVVTDKEATNYVAEIHYPSTPSPEAVTLADYRHDVIKEIFTTLFNQRLRELTQKSNPPFLFAGAGFESIARGYEAFTAQVISPTADVKIPLKTFFEELDKVKKFGFTEAELERAKKNLMTTMETAYNERSKTESANLAEEYIRNFLKKEPIPGIENEYHYYQQFLPGISLTDVNKVAEVLKQNNRKLIAFTGPESDGKTALPTPSDLLSYAEEADKSEVKAYQEKNVGTSLNFKLAPAGKISSTSTNPYAGTRELQLSNGVTVTLKTTDFKNDQVLMGAIRKGGKNGYSVADKYNAEYATAVVSAMGVGDYSPDDMRKVLAGKSASVSPVFSPTSEGISGNSTVKDLETMMQLTYMFLTSPRKDTTLFNSFIQKNKAQTAFLGANPEIAFVDTVYQTVYSKNPLMPVAVPKSEYFDHLDVNRILQIYSDHFGNASGMHFTFVGNFTNEQIEPLIEKYLASLPSDNSTPAFKDNNVRPVKGKVDIDVYKGKEQKSLIIRIYHGEMPYDDKLELEANALAEILNIRIIEELREKIQGIYAGSVSIQFQKYPYPHYTCFLQLPCGPDKIDTLLSAANIEIENIKAKGPSQVNLDKVKQQWIEQTKVAQKDNSSWLNELQESAFTGGDLHYFIDAEKYIKALTVKDVQAVANLVLNNRNVITAILRPEKK